MYAMKGRLNRAVTSRNTVNPLFFATTARFFSVPSAPVCTRSRRKRLLEQQHDTQARSL